jgi:transposase-like protein
MANGQQLGEENVRRFLTWAASKTDAEFRNMAARGSLLRTEIATECGFAKSALAQNWRIREALEKLEAALRERGVLPPIAPVGEREAPSTSPRPADSAHTVREAARISRLEQENASLRAENAEIKRQLGRFAVLQEVLAETGRLLR